jgi:hypothetical protein
MGESHGLEEQRELIMKLLRHPQFPAKVDDVVVEFGNARYQKVLDRYVAGEEVSAAELQQVWRNHTCPGPWSSSAYANYFAGFRAVNRARPPGRRVRVLLGDPPIDWGAVRRPEDFGPFLEQRDAHFARVVEDEVLAKGRKALLVIGGLHLLRKDVPYAPGPAPENVAQLLEKRHPGKLFIVLAHDGLGEGSAAIEKRMGRWPKPSLALLEGTWLGAEAANQMLPGPKLVKLMVNGKEVEAPKPDPKRGPKLQEVADTYLYLGPRETLTLAEDDPGIVGDKAFMDELRRRSKITGSPLPTPQRPARKPRRYIDQVQGAAPPGRLP